MRTFLVMDIHTNITKNEALGLMKKGYTIPPDYYAENEYIYMVNNKIYDEHGYCLGDENASFWNDRQKWEKGWNAEK